MKLHAGQRDIAAAMRRAAEGGQRLLKRETVLYHRHTEQHFEHKVQPYYSLRCIPQILGPVLDTLRGAEEVLVNELNSVDDNPVVDPSRATSTTAATSTVTTSRWRWTSSRLPPQSSRCSPSGR